VLWFYRLEIFAVEFVLYRIPTSGHQIQVKIVQLIVEILR